MKVPEYLRKKIMRRAKLATEFNKVDREIAEWIDSHGIKSEYAMSSYVEAICGEYDAAYDTIKDIEEA